jgi:hypothetical protein
MVHIKKKLKKVYFLLIWQNTELAMIIVSTQTILKLDLTFASILKIKKLKEIKTTKIIK